MQVNYDYKIDSIKKLELKYLNEIRKKLENNDSDYQLDKIKNYMELLKKPKVEETPKTNEQSKSDNAFSNIDQYMFKRPWNRLPEVHKLIKMKEYVTKSLIIQDTNKRDKLISDLFKAIKTKKLTRKGSVNYDPVKGRITSIPNLKYDNNDQIYYLTK